MKNIQDQQNHYQLSHRREDSRLIVYLSGELRLQNLTLFVGETNDLLEENKCLEIVLDLSGVTYLDSAAALAIHEIKKTAARKNIVTRLVYFDEKIGRILGIVHEDALTKPSLKSEKKREGLVVRVGGNTLEVLQDTLNLIVFSGGLLAAIAYALFHPRSLRLKDVLFYMKRAGVDGLPIVGLISALIGLIIAFMSFLQLRMLGANMYVPALVSFAMVKELGPIMTAILVAGRSGSAFAAEIGTMVVNEEVDALKTMGFDALSFLAVPKIFALVIVVPVLTLYADLFGIFGGMLVGVIGLDMSFQTYIIQSLNAVAVFDIATSLIKAAVFAVLIAGIGCQKGFQVRSGAQDVGRFTTSAVVSAIFLIVIADSFFAIVFYYIG
jgi:phospholipid/cholesterol/gamma-HCH transport system permease protein